MIKFLFSLFILCSLAGSAFAAELIDSGNTGHTVTTVDNAQIDTVEKKFGAGSLKLDGAGDYVYAGDHDDWNFGGGNFTIDGWIYMTDLEVQSVIVAHMPDVEDWFGFFWSNANGLSFQAEVGNVLIINCIQGDVDGWSADTWYHVAAVRNGDEWDVYREGTSVANITDSDALGDYTGNLFIGVLGAFGSDFKGQIDEFRISKGIARWTEDFSGSLPSEEYSSDADTKLLLHCNGAPSEVGQFIFVN